MGSTCKMLLWLRVGAASTLFSPRVRDDLPERPSGPEEPGSTWKAKAAPRRELWGAGT